MNKKNRKLLINILYFCIIILLLYGFYLLLHRCNYDRFSIGGPTLGDKCDLEKSTNCDENINYEGENFPLVCINNICTTEIIRTFLGFNTTSNIVPINFNPVYSNESIPIKINNMYKIKDRFQLETNGFEFLKYDLEKLQQHIQYLKSVKEYGSRESLLDNYYTTGKGKIIENPHQKETFTNFLIINFFEKKYGNGNKCYNITNDSQGYYFVSGKIIRCRCHVPFGRKSDNCKGTIEWKDWVDKDRSEDTKVMQKSDERIGIVNKQYASSMKIKIEWDDGSESDFVDTRDVLEVKEVHPPVNNLHIDHISFGKKISMYQSEYFNAIHQNTGVNGGETEEYFQRLIAEPLMHELRGYDANPLELLPLFNDHDTPPIGVNCWILVDTKPKHKPKHDPIFGSTLAFLDWIQPNLNSGEKSIDDLYRTSHIRTEDAKVHGHPLSYTIYDRIRDIQKEFTNKESYEEAKLLKDIEYMNESFSIKLNESFYEELKTTDNIAELFLSKLPKGFNGGWITRNNSKYDNNYWGNWPMNVGDSFWFYSNMTPHSNYKFMDCFRDSLEIRIIYIIDDANKLLSKETPEVLWTPGHLIKIKILQVMLFMKIGYKEIYKLTYREINQIIKHIQDTPEFMPELKSAQSLIRQEEVRQYVNNVLEEEILYRNEMDEQVTFVDKLDWSKLNPIQIKIIEKLGWNESSWQDGDLGPYNQDLTEIQKTELLTNHFSVDFINDFKIKSQFL